MSHERRIHPRTESRLSATLWCDEASVTGMIENIGAGGVFFATEDLEVLIDDGAAVVVRFETTRAGESADIECAGSVLRAERYFDGTRVVRAFAIKFDAGLDLTDLRLTA